MAVRVGGGGEERRGEERREEGRGGEGRRKEGGTRRKEGDTRRGPEANEEDIGRKEMSIKKYTNVQQK